MRRFLPLIAIVSLAIAALVPSTVLAGTQDFTLVNHTGWDIYQIFISESANESWEEDILGENVLPNGGRLPVSFENRSACFWDIKAVWQNESERVWTSINLCEASVVVLTCDADGTCTAEWE